MAPNYHPCRDLLFIKVVKLNAPAGSLNLNMLLLLLIGDYMSGKKWEIKVKGNLGEYKQTGDVKIGSKDIVDALGAYFCMHEEANPKCSDPLAEGQITINIKYAKD